ncbi:YqjF family protein [Streptomyces sp. NPDC014991]|uniref:YqjF family protein n=1 Tax=Streptomyces sp. NPDC014991 TaxID=3364935 RepID=UPI0036FE1008
MVSYGPEQRVHAPVLRAGWQTQTFVHWAYSPDEVQRLLPEGLVVDTFDGAAWVGLTAFVMADVRPPGSPVALPSFAETNLRTYVRDRYGRDGLWFLSVEVACPVMLAARAVGVPYHLGRLDVSRQGDTLSYAGVRRGGGPRYHLAVRPGAQIRPDPRDVWLTSRWRAYTRRLGALWQTPVEHAPWPLRAARLDRVEETLTRAAGLPPSGAEPTVHYSDGVRSVRLGLSRPLRPARDRDAEGGGPPGSPAPRADGSHGRHEGGP